MSTNPTRIDGGLELKIEIIVNPVSQSISITENTHDSLLFTYIMAQALQTYAQRQMSNKNKNVSAPAAVPQ